MGFRIAIFLVLFIVLASSCRRSVQDAVESNTPIDRPILLEASVVSDSSYCKKDAIYTEYKIRVAEVLFDDGQSIDSVIVMERKGGIVGEKIQIHMHYKHPGRGIKQLYFLRRGLDGRYDYFDDKHTNLTYLPSGEMYYNDTLYDRQSFIPVIKEYYRSKFIDQ